MQAYLTHINTLFARALLTRIAKRLRQSANIKALQDMEASDEHITLQDTNVRNNKLVKIIAVILHWIS